MRDCELVRVERLYRQKFRVREIRKLQSEIDVISNELNSPRGVILSDMPRSQNPFDKTGMLVERKIEKEKKLQKLITAAVTESTIIEKTIEKISELPESSKGALNSEYQELLRLHFLCDLSMKEVYKLMKAKDVDFLENEETKIRLLYRWKDEAEKRFEKCQRIKRTAAEGEKQI